LQNFKSTRKLAPYSKVKETVVGFFYLQKWFNSKTFFSAMVYWFYMLKGLDILVWRLETFGFLFSKRLNEDDRKYINQCLK